MRKQEAEVTDIFSSIQGEGLFAGARQVFIRFRRCNLHCRYCDEPRDGRPDVYTPPALIEKVVQLEDAKGMHHSVSLTGGEPLCYADFLELFLPLLQKKGMKSYLETNGTLPDELGRVIDDVDIIAMDIKLPSSTGERAFWDEHSRFLKTAIRKKTFVKAVITPQTTKDDIEKAVRLVTEAATNIPFILQPATPAGAVKSDVPKEKLLEFVDLGIRNRLETIRVLPQLHKMWGVK